MLETIDNFKKSYKNFTVWAMKYVILITNIINQDLIKTTIKSKYVKFEEFDLRRAYSKKNHVYLMIKENW